MKKTSQKVRVIQYIKEFGYITRLHAIKELGVSNLTAVISELRKAGYNIVVENIKVTNRYGDKTTYAKYTLQEDK